jgi:hypothetical protein
LFKISSPEKILYHVNMREQFVLRFFVQRFVKFTIYSFLSKSVLKAVPSLSLITESLLSFDFFARLKEHRVRFFRGKAFEKFHGFYSFRKLLIHNPIKFSF